MKLSVFLILFIFARAQNLTDEQKTNWRNWSKECQLESGASQEAIARIRNNQFDLVDDKIIKHSLCFAKKSNLADSSGKILVDEIKFKLKRVVENDEEVEKIAEKCVVQKTAFDTFKCLRENAPKFVPV